MKNKTIYVPLAVDILHSAHINILKKAKKYGKVIVGLLTDSAISEYKKFPLIDYKERYNTLKGIKFVDQIVEQKNWDYSENIRKYKPNYFIHGDDWKTGIQKNQRKKVIQTLKKINGKLIEVPFSKNISSSEIKDKIIKLSSPINRVSKLKRLMSAKKIVKILESHNALTGLIIENLKINKKNRLEEFDGMEDKLNEQINKNVALNKRLSESVADVILADVSEGLALSQKEKLASLAENVEFESESNYREKLETLRDSYFSANSSTQRNHSENISEGTQVGNQPEVSGLMESYLQTLNRVSKK
jgi:phosphoenolpyruvate phosphomutase / 2-hydroxyethylphosphonate cytidylyltransferase